MCIICYVRVYTRARILSYDIMCQGFMRGQGRRTGVVALNDRLIGIRVAEPPSSGVSVLRRPAVVMLVGTDGGFC
jgi:hypothetical protein